MPSLVPLTSWMGSAGRCVVASVLELIEVDRFLSKASADHLNVVCPHLRPLHGVTQKQNLMLHIAREGDVLTARGEMALQQSDFGIQPFSALGGLMKVADGIAVSFEIVARKKLEYASGPDALL